MKAWVRPLARAAIAGQAAFIAAWILAGALEPGYSPAKQAVSELGGTFVRHPWIMNAAFVIMGMSLAALVPGLWAVLPRRRAAIVTVALFGLGALAFVLLMPYRMECSLSVDHGCISRFHTGQLDWLTYAHVWDSFAARLALVLTPFALARALWPSPMAGASLGAGITGLAVGLVAWALYGIGGSPDGVVERWELLTLNLWVVIVAVGILHETRRPPALPAPTPLRPRDFFGSKWTGHGRVLLWPWALWSRVPLTFALTREQIPISDEVWIVEDRAIFAGGHVESRRMFCELVDPTLIRVTANELPDGAKVHLDDAGFAIAPYRVHVRVGPLRLPLSCRDESVLEEDGTLVNTVTGRLFGMPAVRLVACARPVETRTREPVELGTRN